MSLHIASTLVVTALIISAIREGKVRAMAAESIVPDHCKNRPPVKSGYKPIGKMWKLNDLDIYETQSNSTKVLISVYDIFGFHPNTEQVADILTSVGGFRVVMPDFFRGSALSPENFPPKDPSVVMKLIQERGTWETTVRDDMLRVIDHYRRVENITSFGLYGFCWGGKIVLKAASELPQVKAAALIHPWGISTEDANSVKAPMYLMPSKEEADMVPFYELLKARLGKENCGHRRFENMIHGFCAARGNFSDPENIQAVDEVIGITTSFFTKYL